MSVPEKRLPDMGDAAILVVAEKPASLAAIGAALEDRGLKPEKLSSAARGVERAGEKEFDVIVVDIRMADMTGLEFLKMVKVFRPETEVVLLNGQRSVSSAVAAMSLGAFDYLPKPFDAEELALSIQRALVKRHLMRESKTLEEWSEGEFAFDDIVGRCERMQEIFRLIQRIAPTKASVIIQGESGTGKELIARAIHRNSQRQDREFLAINSASLPETLLESELFGYRRGAFTGAEKDKKGLLESADRGTLLLDEIGSMSRQLQGKLLRVMQEGEIVPVGSSERVKIDVRFLAASNRNLWEMVQLGEFRKDLYYRLSVIEITVPPLRERIDDIPLLAEHFLRRFSEEHGVEPKGLATLSLRKLLRYNWPGNIRELENVIRRAVIVSRGKAVNPKDIELRPSVSPSFPGSAELLSMPYREAKKVVENEFQKAYLRGLLSRCGGSVSEAAKRARLSRQTIHDMVRTHGLKSRRAASRTRRS